MQESLSADHHHGNQRKVEACNDRCADSLPSLNVTYCGGCEVCLIVAFASSRPQRLVDPSDDEGACDVFLKVFRGPPGPTPASLLQNIKDTKVGSFRRLFCTSCGSRIRN